MYYNHSIKTYPDGTELHTVFKQMRQTDFKRVKVKKTGKSVKRKEIDNNKRAVNKVYDLARSNNWDWFITLTLDPKICDRYDYQSVSEQLSKFKKYLTEHDIQYLIVPEQHKDGAYHFHGLIQGNLSVVPAKKNDGSFIPDVFWVKGYKLGFCSASKIRDNQRVSTYITKYLTKKLSVPKGKKRYWASTGLNKPVVKKCSDIINQNEIWWYEVTADFQKNIHSQFCVCQLFEFRP